MSTKHYAAIIFHEKGTNTQQHLSKYLLEFGTRGIYICKEDHDNENNSSTIQRLTMKFSIDQSVSKMTREL